MQTFAALLVLTIIVAIIIAVLIDMFPPGPPTGTVHHGYLDDMPYAW